MNHLHSSALRIGLVIAALFGAYSSQSAATLYGQANLVSDLPGVATFQDPHLVNPWGIATSPTSPFWIADNHTGLSTLYKTDGSPQPLVVTLTPTQGATTASPTGIVFNGSSGFAGSHFIFATEDGAINAWTSGTTAAIVASGIADSVYKGLTLANNGTSDFLYAANFGTGAIDVFDNTFASTTLSGSFADPNLPAGYAPFDIANINGLLYVTYALQNDEHKDDVSGSGHGFVDVYDANGTLLSRFATEGVLNSPWGLAVAPSHFGQFSNALLVGNFGDGIINAFDPLTGILLGQLRDSNANPIQIPGLWALRVGNGGNGGDPNAVYFTAGIPGPDAIEDHGLFGKLAAIPEPGTLLLLGAGLVGLASSRRNAQPRLAY
ncbi:MAG: TIGR03118 family protein [Betaproteobacteria bacterium]